MQLNERDKAYLWDILDARKDIIGFTSNTTFSEFDTDKMRRFAVERQLILIGEAANHISDEVKSFNSNIPWPLIIGLRNVIAH